MLLESFHTVPGGYMNSETALTYKNAIDNYIEEHREPFLAQLSELCRINSEKAQPQEGMPYGAGAAECLAAALNMAEESGFEVRNYDGYVGTVDLNSTLPARLDILAHLDVVPAGSGWTETEPFSPLVKDGRIYGRGTSDDKGPAIAVLYAMQAVKELGIPLRGNVRLILGTDEECGSSDIAYYYSKEKEAPMTFSPDAEFPVVNIEKGRFHGRLFKKFRESSGGSEIVAAGAGIKVNVVPANAQALIRGIPADEISKACDRACTETEVNFMSEEREDGILVSAAGKGAHASTPEDGNNALTGLLVFLAKLPFENIEQISAVKELLSFFPHGDVNGTALGLDMSDEISGRFTSAISILEMDPAGISAEFDCRIPVCGDNSGVPDIIREKVGAAGFTLEAEAYSKAHHVPGDSDFVRTLLASYETFTGEKGECIAMGGGTYVHDLEHGVAFGAIMPGTDTHMHGPDEFAVIDELITAAKIYALAIIQLCG